MTPVAAVLALAPGNLLVGSVLWLFFPRLFLTGGRTTVLQVLHSLLVPYGRYATSNAVIIQTSATGKKDI